ncbi:MAG: MaoC family dehydratase N-terminal domain-containing protein [Sphingomonadaceae bacterium]|uniref:MaoC family dehydratase n=1 Tax=Thermaurantiacus sp. TaxID=2820283 RepID=UPI00298F3D62|nr:MaoC family dehydratase N-terminal domain-containing protein [Thermaurantiacus sp.]MCS6987030.1 MaoC family dehydratase N-terminal domain-containing protein [Sphingomonadaceae bacterium]MDW8415632.1 acyl dehydratase [Thermaurantiacus sp.]
MADEGDGVDLFNSLPVLGKGPTWDELRPGLVGRTLRRTITEADLINFISVTGMLEAIFIDAAYPGRAIDGRLVPAALTQGLVEGMLFQSVIQGVGLALLEIHTFAHAPVRVGDSIWATLEIRDIRPTSKGGRAVVTQFVTVYNQRGEKVLSYEVKRLVAGRG